MAIIVPSKEKRHSLIQNYLQCISINQSQVFHNKWSIHARPLGMQQFRKKLAKRLIGQKNVRAVTDWWGALIKEASLGKAFPINP